MAWGSKAVARDGRSQRRKSSQGYQQGLWEQADRGRPVPLPPTSCANLGERLSLSRGVPASRGVVRCP